MATRAEYRRALAQELGQFGVFTAESGSTSTLVCPTAFRSTELPTSALAHAWIYVPAGSLPNQRRVKATGLDPATGTITVDYLFGSAVASSTVFEVHTKIPGARDTSLNVSASSMLGANECVNLALRHILVEDDSQTITLTNGTRDYSLSSYTWLDRPERLLDVRVLDAAGGGYVSTRKTFEFRESGAGNTLHFHQPFRIVSGSYTAKLVAMRPADTLISGATSTNGLVAESDTAVPDVNSVVTVALAFAYKALAATRRTGGGTRYEELYAEQVKLARKVRNYDLTNDIDPSVKDGPPVPEAA